MNQKFKERIDNLPFQLKDLQNCMSINRNNLKDVPERGVYLFSENNKPLYVGRTNRMRARLLEHGRKSSGHNDASFAFKMAKDIAKDKGVNVDRKRKDLVIDSDFIEFFSKSKDDVAAMNIRYIRIDDPVDQYLFEVYASEALNTPYNDFENH